MTCTFDRELLALFMNGDLSSEECHATAAHLSECDECQGIMRQYRSAADELAGSLADVRPTIRRAAPRWGRAAAAALATMLVLVGALQVPAVAAEVNKLFPFMELFEMDKKGVAAFIWRFSNNKVSKVYTPEHFKNVAEAEKAWGGTIPQPGFRPESMDLSRIEMFRLESGDKDLYLLYQDAKSGGNLTVHLSTLPLRRRLPEGATKVTLANGQEALVARGPFSQSQGEPPKAEADADILVGFPTVPTSTISS